MNKSKNYIQDFYNKIRNQFSKYVIKDGIKEDFFGTVKHGNFAKVSKGIYNDREVAIKEIWLSKENIRTVDDDELSAIYVELTVLSQIANDNIPKLLAIMMDEGNLKIYLILEYIDGSTLGEHIESGISNSWNYTQKLWILYKICKILCYIREVGVIHRDVKPENIMIEVDSNLEPHLIDFGLSKLKEKDKFFQATNAKCTPCYSPPENMYDTITAYAKLVNTSEDNLNMEVDSNSKLTKVSSKVDVWSFGCVIYQLYTLNLPFLYLCDTKKDLSLGKILKLLQQGKKIYSPEEEKLFPEIMHIVDNCTKISIDERWEINDALDALGKLLANQRIQITENLDGTTYSGSAVKLPDDTLIYDGIGTYNDNDNGTSYIGSFEYGCKSGFGIEKGEAIYYQGMWRNNQKNGQGYFRYNEYGVDTYYLGNFKNDKRSGHGRLVKAGTVVLEGLFIDDYLIEGFKYDKRYLYKGKFASDSMVFGEVIDLDTNEIYQGEFEDDAKHGIGFTFDNLKENKTSLYLNLENTLVKKSGLWKEGELEIEVHLKNK